MDLSECGLAWLRYVSLKKSIKFCFNTSGFLVVLYSQLKPQTSNQLHDLCFYVHRDKSNVTHSVQPQHLLGKVSTASTRGNIWKHHCVSSVMFLEHIQYSICD